MNYFASPSAAARYAQGRPYFHPKVIRRIQATLALTEPVGRALDVGCGTGLSTRALIALAAQVVGVDCSVAMLAWAPRDARLRYVVAPAEALPVRDASVDLLTLACALHWLDHQAFFAEAGRVVRPPGWLIVYDNAFAGQMRENTAYQTWHRAQYLMQYPSPPRARVALSEIDPARTGFQVVGQDEYEHWVAFSVETLVDYLVTQSHIIAAVEGGRTSLMAVREWLTTCLAPLFGARTVATFLFHGPIWYWRRAVV